MHRLKTLIRHALFALFALLPLTAASQPQKDLKVFFYGNSLIHHLTDSDETTVPHWLFHLAQAGGHGFAADGVWGFPADFARNLPPEPNWSFRDVPRVWTNSSQAFRRVGFDTIIYNPPNFIQYDPPDHLFDGASVTELTARVFDWTSNQAHARYYIYEGWSFLGDYGRFPPNARGMARFHAYNMGDYHAWYLDYVDQVRALRPNADITLIPVASVLARILSDGPLAELGPRDLYSDESPHGTANKYLLAAMVTYAALYNEPPPRLDLPETIHPLIRDSYAEVSAAIWAGVSGAAPLEEARAGEAEAEAEAEPIPVVLPGEPVENPSLSMGLNGIADYSPQHPFIDMMKSARPWTGHTATQWGAWDAERLMDEGYLSPEGWPLAIPQELDRIEAFILTDQDPRAGWLSGSYILTYDGQGAITLAGLARDVRAGPGEIRFSYSPGDGLVAIAITAVDPGDPIRNIRVMREDMVPLHEAGEVFNPHWLRLVRDLRAVRFMDWMDTNASPIATWDDRPKTDDYTWVWRGVPVEVMVDLANLIGVDPWFTMPHLADDDYARRFATYVRDHLDPRLIAYVEWSNEVWNFGFVQTQWVLEQARLLWGDAAEQDGWMQYSGMRAAQIADIWTDVFGDEAESRLIRVVATHTSWPGLEEGLLLAPLSQAMGNPPPVDSFDAYAVTGYFGFETGGEDFAPTLHRWIEEGSATANMTAMLREGSLADLTGRLFPYHAAVAAEHGLEMVMYEGGTHVVGHGAVTNDDVITDFFIAYNYSPEMAGLYADLLAGWDAAGGTLFNAFVDVGNPSRWGSWGNLRHLDDMTPRWATLMAYNARPPAWAEPRAAGTFTPWAE